ncbi:Uma2 family endonuclease [Microseira sp. BLCC-F43]|jgi:Uma2 family endonuclease|uniref:Uma2 family endonuclease n=1 Tax=Microseira sp. BLCC-F43 TaxID=3153602 RepID=UPI0035BA08E7
MIPVTQQRYYSPQEYLELEEAAEFRSEYHAGEIIPMTGGTPNHNQIAGNFYAAILAALRGQPYRVFMTDLRLWIPQRKIYTYPDVMVASRPVELLEGRKDTITNPLMIAEVLSISTESYDRGKKFEHYRTIPTFQEYILIDQYRMHVDQFSKTEEGRWLFSEYDGEGAVLSLTCVKLQIPLPDIYQEIEFEAEEDE